MAKKKKCKCPDPGLTAPFYMLTYGDMMTLLMCFFVLLFAMSTIQSEKFFAQIGILQGSLGISPHFQHSPMQERLPAPSVRQSRKINAQAQIQPEEQQTQAEFGSVASSDPMKEEEERELKSIRTLGTQGNLEMSQTPDELIISLPTYGIFEKGSWTISAESPEVKRVIPLYEQLAEQIAELTSYDVFLVGHTDSVPVISEPIMGGPENNIELGFMRAIALYEFFFAERLLDRTRITFASQGDNVPVIPDAKLDSEHRKNRRVQIHLKKKSFGNKRS